MAKKSGVYIGSELEAAIGPLHNSISVSHRINRLGDRYREIMRRTQIEKKLTEAEWNLMRDSLNGTINEPASQITRLWHGIEDSIKLDGLAQKWDVDGDALLSKLRDLTYVEEVAAVEFVERWWIENGTWRA